MSVCLASPAHVHIRIAARIAIHSSPMWGVQGSAYLPTEQATLTNCNTWEQGLQRRDCTFLCALPYRTPRLPLLPPFCPFCFFFHGYFLSLFNFFIFFLVALFATHTASCSTVPTASQREKPKSFSLQYTKGLWTRLFSKHCTSTP